MNDLKKRSTLFQSSSIWLVGTIIAILLEDPVKDFVKLYTDSSIIIDFAIPAIGLMFPFIIFVFALYKFTKVDDKLNINSLSQNTSDEVIVDESTSSTNDENYVSLPDETKNKYDLKDLIPGLQRLGIVNVTKGLRTSKYAPLKCMEDTKRKLLFIGILGSKWVKEDYFVEFLDKIDARHGDVRFLLINPLGKAYHKLYKFRKGDINASSLEAFDQLSEKYECLRVKLYDDLPSFRMIFMDNKMLAVSRYKLDRQGHFESEFGWANPHLIIDSSSDWSLYGAFEDLYHQIWNASTDLEDYFSEVNNEQ